MNTTEQRALDYIRGVKGGPTEIEFHAMNDPIGPILLPKLTNAGLVRRSNDGHLHLTADANDALSSAAV